MIDDKFEWDDAKASANLAKHGVSFERAKLVFRDIARFEAYDDRRHYGEDRFVATGDADGVILVVVHTEREGRVRIISARRATRHERQTYVENRGD
jgi:uncharacterized DUF497 family protein